MLIKKSNFSKLKGNKFSFSFSLFIIIYISLISIIESKENNKFNNLFYPQSEFPVKNLNVFYEKNLTIDETFTLNVAAGILAKKTPLIYIRENKEISQQDIWLKEMQEIFKVNLNYDLQGTSGLMHIIKQNIKYFKGIYIYEANDNNQHLAVISLCGVNNALPLEKSNTFLIKYFKEFIPILKDCSNPPISPKIIFDEWKNSPNKSTKVLIYNDPGKFKMLSDYAAFSGAFYFQEKLEDEFTDKVFNLIEDNGAVFGWGAEEDLVSYASRRNLVIHAYDFSQNLSVSTNLDKRYLIEIKDKYLKNNLNEKEKLKSKNLKNLKKKAFNLFRRFFSKIKKYFSLKTQEKKSHPINPTNKNNNKHTVCFLMSDGDNLQWLQNAYLQPAWFGHPKRGQIPVSWTLSVSIVDLLPEIYTYLIRNKTKNDYFVSAPSGEGYTYPSIYPNYISYTEKMKKFMERFGVKSLNILDSAQNPKKEIIEEMSKFSNSIFYYPYGNYAGWKGKIQFVNDNTAIIGGRHRLWSDFNNPESLAKKLNSYSNNPMKSDGYSLIPVHVWSEDYGKVLETLDLLDKNKVEVLGLDEFVQKILKNVEH